MTNRRTLLFLLIAAIALPAAATGGEGFAFAGAGMTPEVSISVAAEPGADTIDLIARFDLPDGLKLYSEDDKLYFDWQDVRGVELQEVLLPDTIEAPDPLSPGDTMQVFQGRVEITARFAVTVDAGEHIMVRGALHHMSCTDELCNPPAKESFSFQHLSGEGALADGGPGTAEPAERPAEPATPTAEPDPEDEGLAGVGGLFWQLVLAFFAGLVISFTPCVYPMYPVTAAVIGARRDGGLAGSLLAAAVYVLGLAVVYAVLGLLVARLGAAVHNVLQSPYVLVPVALIFVGLAVVMFRGIDMRTSGLGHRLQSKLAGRRGLPATFALGAVSGLIASPCVAAPLAGLLLFIARTGNTVLGFWMLFVLAWGMGVPLVLFGTATGLMPKAGPWMDWFKLLLGFVLIWGALYFLRFVIGGLVYQVGFGVLLVVAAVFLGGFDRLTAESGLADRLKRAMGTLMVIGAVLLIGSAALGQLGVPAQEVTGVAPGSIFQITPPEEVRATLDRGEPVILDFWAEWCVNCKVLDRRVYSQPEARTATEGLATYKIDVGEHAAFARDEFEVFMPPALLFVSPDGTVWDRRDGMLDLAEFLELVEAFRQAH